MVEEDNDTAFPSIEDDEEDEATVMTSSGPAALVNAALPTQLSDGAPLDASPEVQHPGFEDDDDGDFEPTIQTAPPIVEHAAAAPLAQPARLDQPADVDSFPGFEGDDEEEEATIVSASAEEPAPVVDEASFPGFDGDGEEEDEEVATTVTAPAAAQPAPAVVDEASFPGFDEEEDEDESTVLTQSAREHASAAPAVVAAFPGFDDDDDDDESTVLTASARSHDAPTPAPAARPLPEPSSLSSAPAPASAPASAPAPAATPAAAPAATDFPGFDDDDDESTVLTASARSHDAPAPPPRPLPAPAQPSAPPAPPRPLPAPAQPSAPSAPQAAPTLPPPPSEEALRILTARAPTAAAIGFVELDELPWVPPIAELLPEVVDAGPRSVDDALDELRREHGEVRAKEAGAPLSSEDEVCLELAGFVQAEPIPFSRVSQMWIPLEADPDRPGLFEGIARMRVGETENLVVEPPIEDWDESAPLPPRTWYAVHVRAARSLALPAADDPSFLARVGLGDTVGEVRARLAERVRGADERDPEALRMHVLAALAQKTEVALPEALVEGELQLRWIEANEAATASGGAVSSDVAAWGADAEIRAVAERALRLTVALQVVAEQSGVVIDDAAIHAYVAAVARGSDTSAESLSAALAHDAGARGAVVEKLRHLAAIDVVASALAKR